jgi:Leucine-rich repeat (LRR) protein
MWRPATAVSALGCINPAVVLVVALPSIIPLVLADAAVCPDSCWCNNGDSKSVAVCWDHNLTRIPQNFDKKLQEIALMFNNISTINDYVFYGLTNVTIMLLQYNGIREVREHAFDGLYNLIFLDLSHNMIFKIPSKVVQNNERIKFFYLNHNEISISGPFLISTSLSVLDISFCKITTLPHDAFIGTPNLMKLKINNNHITEFEMYAFRGLRNLEVLSSGNNLIKYLDSDLFVGLDEIKYIDFSNNSVSTLSPQLFEKNRKLRYLFLKNNSLSIRNSGPILISESLSHLDISFCNITYMPPNAFIRLNNLTSLRMIGNPLENLDTKTMQPLRKLQVILFGPDSSCSESSLQNLFDYFKQKSVAYYAPPLCSTDSPVTNPTIFYSYPSTTMPSGHVLQVNISNIIHHSRQPSLFNNSSQIKILSHVIHEHIALMLAVSCVLKVCR